MKTNHSVRVQVIGSTNISPSSPARLSLCVCLLVRPQSQHLLSRSSLPAHPTLRREFDAVLQPANFKHELVQE